MWTQKRRQIVVIRKGESDMPEPNSVEGKCALCHSPILVGPSGQHYARATDVVICLQCAYVLDPDREVMNPVVKKPTTIRQLMERTKAAFPNAYMPEEDNS